MTAARILMRCDAGPRLGSGHAMRCLTLARALAGRGASITFAASPETFEWVPPLAAAGFPAIYLERPLEADELAGLDGRWDAVVVDHYGLDARHEAALRRVAPVILVIDDLADRPHDCDILVDQTVGREAADYAALVPPGAELRLGPDYALIRPEFARARPAALAARAAGGPVSRILVSLGMTDIGGITAWAARATLAAGLDAEVAVAVGSRAASLPELRRLAQADPRLVLYPDCSDICALMAASDLAIGAGGTTSWERCCLGLPTIMLVLAGNQALIARNLARVGAAEALPGRDATELTAALRRLATDPAARVAMSRRAAELVDGRGAEHIVRNLSRTIAARQLRSPDVYSPVSASAPQLKLRARVGVLEDAEEIWIQRSDPVTQRNARNCDYISWPEHCEWFERALRDPTRMICMVDLAGIPEFAGRGMAVVRFEGMAEHKRSWLVSLSLAPAFRGLKLGRPALRAACQLFFEMKGVTCLCAEIRPENTASVRVFKGLGFKRSRQRRTPGFEFFVRPAKDIE